MVLNQTLPVTIASYSSSEEVRKDHEDIINSILNFAQKYGDLQEKIIVENNVGAEVLITSKELTKSRAIWILDDWKSFE